MSFLDEITVLILTYNEEANIGRMLGALSAFSDILVLDSGSTDETLDVVRGYQNTRVIMRPFDTHASQWNYGLSACTRPWVLALDADYILPQALVRSITDLSPAKMTAGYKVAFRYCIFAHPLSASLYPPAVVLFRREGAVFVQEGHTQRVNVPGAIETLPHRIDHDDRKSLSRWLQSQQNYARLEANYLLETAPTKMTRADRIRRIGWLAPVLVLFYVLFVKGCILDGWAGWIYALQRLLAELLIALELAEARMTRGNG